MLIGHRGDVVYQFGQIPSNLSLIRNNVNLNNWFPFSQNPLYCPLSEESLWISQTSYHGLETSSSWWAAIHDEIPFFLFSALIHDVRAHDRWWRERFHFCFRFLSWWYIYIFLLWQQSLWLSPMFWCPPGTWCPMCGVVGSAAVLTL